MKAGQTVTVLRNNVRAKKPYSRIFLKAGDKIIIKFISEDQTRIYYNYNDSFNNWLPTEDVVLPFPCKCSFISFLKNGCKCGSWIGS